MTGRSIGLPAIGVLVVLAVGYGASEGTIFLVATALPMAIAALGQDLILNRFGLASFGGAAFMAVGAFSVAKTQQWLPFPLPLVDAAMLGAVVGGIAGLPGVRVRGFYLLLATLALQSVVSYLTFRIQGGQELGI